MTNVITTGMRVGSTWISDFCTDLCDEEWEFYGRGDFEHTDYDETNQWVFEDSPAVVKLHDMPPMTLVNTADREDHDVRVVVIRRNLFDRIASYLRFERHGESDRTPEGYWNEFKGMSDRESLDEIICERDPRDPMHDYMQWMIRSWLMYRKSDYVPFNHPHILCLHYTELEMHSWDVSKRIYNHILCSDLSHEDLKSIWEKHRFESRTGRSKGEQDLHSHYQRGQSDYWPDVVSERSAAHIQDMKQQLSADFFARS